MNRKEIKAKAKELSWNNKTPFWKGTLVFLLIAFAIGLAVGVVTGLINGLISSGACVYSFNGECVFNPVDSIGSILETLFLAPITFGYLYYVMCYARGKEFQVNDLFRYKSKMAITFVLLLLIDIFVSLWTLLFIIPGIIAAFAYAMAPMIWVDEENSPMEAIRASKELMKGHKWEYFVFGLSFIGWILLSCLTLGILYIWVIPYMQTAEVLYYDELKKLKN